MYLRDRVKSEKGEKVQKNEYVIDGWGLDHIKVWLEFFDCFANSRGLVGPNRNRLFFTLIPFYGAINNQFWGDLSGPHVTIMEKLKLASFIFFFKKKPFFKRKFLSIQRSRKMFSFVYRSKSQESGITCSWSVLVWLLQETKNREHTVAYLEVRR